MGTLGRRMDDCSPRPPVLTVSEASHWYTTSSVTDPGGLLIVKHYTKYMFEALQVVPQIDSFTELKDDEGSVKAITIEYHQKTKQIEENPHF